MPREDEQIGLKLPGMRATPSAAYGYGTTIRESAGAVSDFTGRAIDRAGQQLYENVARPAYEQVGEPTGQFFSGLFGPPSEGTPASPSVLTTAATDVTGATPAALAARARALAARPRAPATPVVTPATARPNARAAEPAAAPRARAAGPDTTKFPYGLDLRKLQAMFPTAINAPPASSNGLAVRERQPGQSMAPVIPRAPRRKDSRDLDKETEDIIGSLRHVRGGSGGFGDLMRYRMALGFAGREMLPIAAERARRGEDYESAMEAYEAEQGLGLKLADLELGRERLAQGGEIARADLAQRTMEGERGYGLDRFGSQWDVIKGLMTLDQAERAATTKTATAAQKGMKLYKTQSVHPETGQVIETPHLFTGFDPTGRVQGQRLPGAPGVYDRYSEVQ